MEKPQTAPVQETTKSQGEKLKASWVLDQKTGRPGMKWTMQPRP